MTDRDWPAIKRAYETGTERIADLCRRFGIARSELTKRRRLEAWAMRGSGIEDLRALRLARAGTPRAGKAQRPDLSAADIAAIKALYEADGISVAAIRNRYGLSETHLRTLRTIGGWRTRLRVADPTGAAPQSAASETNAMARRLLRSLRRQITALETRTMRDDYVPTSGDARLTEDLARSAKRISALVEGDPAKAAAGRRSRALDNTKKEEAEAADVEWIRAQLQNRLDVLAQRTRSGCGPEGGAGLDDPQTSPHGRMGGAGAPGPETAGD